MGFYKLYRIIKDFLKKPFRTAFIFIIIVIIISLFSGSAFAVETIIEHPYQKDGFYSTDPINWYLNYYDNVCISFLSGLVISKENKDPLYDKVIDLMKNNFYHIERLNNKNATDASYRLIIYNLQSIIDSTQIDTHISFYNDYISMPITGNNLASINHFSFNLNNNKLREYDNYTFFVPTPVLGLKNQYVEQYFREEGSKSTNDLFFMLQSIKESIDETNEFLKDDTKDDTVISTLPDNSSSSNDPTETGFNNIFNSFKNAFTNNSSLEFEIKIPFANKSFWLESNFISRYAKKWTFVAGITFLDFIHMFWYFVFSLYIVKDVEKVVEKIKNGDIATSSDTNIKTDML
ncbi:MAG: hypothetical protein HFJ25_03825 [Clostridia bacterium]|nr:hypothetical protein [Clostridia bacterium]